ncbi:MAG: histidine phosphatase family protein [Firmicutes bacterium]|nr:histidine phosphatase family protein [Bacillota bacterium]
MQKVFLVRHGETNWNLQMRFQGKENIPLNETGKNQAQLVSQRLSSEKFSEVFSSPLLRTLETAKNIAFARDLKPQPVEGLSEIYFGNWEGKVYTEMNEKEQKHVDQWMINPENSVIPNGEQFEDFKDRVLKSYEELLAADERKENFVIVTHAGAIKVLVAGILGMPFSKINRLRLSPASLTTILYDDWKNAYLDVYNDTCHLAV